MRRKYWFEKIMEENKDKIVDEVGRQIKKLINNELKEKERDYFKDNDLVILVKDNKTHIYEYGEEIKYIGNVTFNHESDSIPIIEYKKMVR